MKKPSVSVIIPVYNEEKYLNFCLSSILEQTYENKEIIVVDDGSNDKSFEIAKQYNVKLLKEKHKGTGNARNKGAQKAKGEILIFADADMSYKKDYIEKLIKPILSEKAIGTFTKDEFVANKENIWSKCWTINSGLPNNRRLPENYKNKENAFRAILKKYFIKAGGFDTAEGYTDDTSLSKKLGIEASNAPGAVSYHYNPSGILEVFYSSRWIGKSKLFKPNFRNFIRFSPINSIRVSFKYLLKGAPFRIFIFKIVFDFGMFSGVFFKGNNNHK